MSRDPRFEVVRTDAGWHARFVASNGQTVWVTESYRKKETAVRAIDTLARHFSPTGQAWVSNVRVGNERHVEVRYGSEDHRTWSDAHRLDVRLVDERTQP
jgi:uncharacterized protein YegP (UPF0339 family)